LKEVVAMKEKIIKDGPEAGHWERVALQRDIVQQIAEAIRTMDDFETEVNALLQQLAQLGDLPRGLSIQTSP